MRIRRRLVMAGAASAAMIRRAGAQTRPLRVGVLTDMSGPYKDLGGAVSVAAAHQAVEDFAASGHPLAIEIVSADHQNKPDVGVGIARQWFDRDGVDLIVDVPNSGVALAVSAVAKEKNKVFIDTGAGTSDLTGIQCNANTIHWTYDTYMLAKSTGGAIAGRGGKDWFFITANYAFGQALQRDTTQIVIASGGTVLGAAPYPFPGTTDFSSFLVQAQSSGAKVLGLASAGADTVNQIKQAREFGLSLTLAALLFGVEGVHAIGLETAAGILLSESYYWDLNDRTRAFAERLRRKIPADTRPGMAHAGTYAATLHYLKTAAGMGAEAAGQDGARTVAAMKKLPTEDDCFGAGRVREDGSVLHNAYLFQVKTPAQSKHPWDYYTLLATTPGDEAFRPLNEGGCALVKT